MDVSRSGSMRKGNNVFTSVARNTSCSSGWLRLVIQSIFATITVISFILIVLMALKNPRPSPGLRPTIKPRCQISSCRVVCKDAPYFEEFYEDIVLSVSEADTKCVRIVLELQNASFVNNTIPKNWLSNMRSNVQQLTITGGNLKHIAYGAFMSQFSVNIRTLIFHNIQLQIMKSTSLVGLSNLRTFNILNSKISNVSRNALMAVDDTLQTLTISHSGDWDPTSFTGTRGFYSLGIVDFSHNYFQDTLSRHCFVGLEYTKILYLNSCSITSIGSGTFDYLSSIEVLYLNNNMLVSVPVGLFSQIVSIQNPRPRINLQDNFWFCDCSVDDLRQLSRKELLLVETRCTYPQEMNSKTFTQFDKICYNNTIRVVNTKLNSSRNEDKGKQLLPETVYVNGNFCRSNGRKTKAIVRILSPVQGSQCSSMEFDLYNFTSTGRSHEHSVRNISKWISFSYFLRTITYSVVQIGAQEQRFGYGLLWYQSECPNEIYCLDVIPTYLRVYSLDLDAHYTFCPMSLKSARIDPDNCIGYDFLDFVDNQSSITYVVTFRVTLYIITIIICLFFGAVLVYALIRKKPILLKGSKRILFVKHKNLDALVLPPKVPLRNNLKNDKNDFQDKNIFTLSTDQQLKLPNLKRIKSVKSNKSVSPSYISAMQPTDDQLAEWRIKHHFNNDLTITSVKSELSTLSSIGDHYYNSLDDCDRTYESLK